MNDHRDTAPPDLRWLAWAVIAAGVVLFIVVGVLLQIKLGNPVPAAPGITQIDLPASSCPAPETGQALVITVFAPDPDGKSRRAVCQLVAGRTI